MASISLSAIEYFFMSGVTLSGCSGNIVFLVSEFVLEDSSFSDSSGTAAALQIVNTTATIKRSSFINNHNQNSRGGALYVENSTVVFSESSISKNRRRIYCMNSIITVNRSVICDNPASNHNYNDKYVGGFYAVNSTIVFNRSHISHNSARSYGAAVYGIDVAISFTACNVSNHRAALVVHVCTSFDCSTITISDSIFSYNQVHYGAVLSGTDIVLNIQRSSLHNNKNMNYRYGGIIHASSESHTCKMSMAIYESNFERNAAYDGGAAVYSTSTNVTIVDSNFLRHYVEQYYYTPNRAALYLTGSIIIIKHCIFSNNIAFRGGSALYISTNRATIQKSTFHNNIAISGFSGAIYIYVTDLNMTQCIFKDNLAIESGGAMYINADTNDTINITFQICLLYTSPSPRDATLSRMPSSA